MPLNDRKINALLLQQCGRIEERCDGYKEQMINVITEILHHEYQHRISATNIQKKINNECSIAARFLSTKRSIPTDTEG